MKKEMEGILGREGTQPAIKDEDGKTRFVYNLFDGFTGKNVKLTIEEVAEAEEEEVEWTEAEKGEEEEEIEWSEVEEETGELEIFEGMDTKEETGGEKPEA